MKKHNAKHAPFQPSQVQAIRRLAKVGKLKEALDRVDRLIALHPEHKPLFGLAWEIASEANDRIFAVERALDWTRASPNSANAWQALADDAFASGFAALGLHAQERLAALAGQTLPPGDAFATPFGMMRKEEAIANDTARVYMRLDRFNDALAVLEGHDHVSLHNNAALIRFRLGEVHAALAAFEECWRREPRNLFALEYIVRLRLWTQGFDAAAALTAPLKATPALRGEDALAKVSALLILGDDAGADASWREAAEADFWQGPPETMLVGLFDFAGAIAALRLGDKVAAAERFDKAKENLRDRRELIQKILIAAALPELGEQPDIPLGNLVGWFPSTWIDSLEKLRREKGRSLEDRHEALMRTCDAHTDYLGIVAEFGGEAGRLLALSILKLRAREGDAAARQKLVDLLALSCGPDNVRTGLHADMVDLGLLPKDGTVSMLVQGKVREIRLMAMKIHAEPSPPELPPAAQSQLQNVFDLLARRQVAACITILEALIEKHPDVPALYHNLASIKENLGHPEGEIESLLQKAHALDPNYLFAIAGLARLAARRGDIERAKNMLDPLLRRDTYHYSEWRTILMTQIEMAKGQGETVVAQNLQRQLLELQERFS